MRKNRPRSDGGWTPKRIRDLRKRHRWIRKKFAQVIDVSEMTIYRWEKGLVVPIKVMRERLAKLESFDLDGAQI